MLLTGAWHCRALLLFQNGMTIVLTVLGTQLGHREHSTQPLSGETSDISVSLTPGAFEMRPWRLADMAQFAVQETPA